MDNIFSRLNASERAIKEKLEKRYGIQRASFLWNNFKGENTTLTSAFHNRPDYLKGVKRTVKTYKSLKDIPESYDFYIVDPPWSSPGRSADAYVKFSPESYSIGFEFAKKTPKAVLYCGYEGVPGFFRIYKVKGRQGKVEGLYFNDRAKKLTGIARL